MPTDVKSQSHGGLRSATARPEPARRSDLTQNRRLQETVSSQSRFTKKEGSGLRFATGRPELTANHKNHGDETEPARDEENCKHNRKLQSQRDGGLRSATARPEPATRSSSIQIRGMQQRGSSQLGYASSGHCSVTERPRLACCQQENDTTQQSSHKRHVDRCSASSYSVVAVHGRMSVDACVSMCRQPGPQYGGLRSATARPEPAIRSKSLQDRRLQLTSSSETRSTENDGSGLRLVTGRPELTASHRNRTEQQVGLSQTRSVQDSCSGLRSATERPELASCEHNQEIAPDRKSGRLVDQSRVGDAILSTTQRGRSVDTCVSALKQSRPHDGGLRSATARPGPAIGSKSEQDRRLQLTSFLKSNKSTENYGGGLRSVTGRPELTASYTNSTHQQAVTSQARRLEDSYSGLRSGIERPKLASYEQHNDIAPEHKGGWLANMCRVGDACNVQRFKAAYACVAFLKHERIWDGGFRSVTGRLEPANEAEIENAHKDATPNVILHLALVVGLWLFCNLEYCHKVLRVVWEVLGWVGLVLRQVRCDIEMQKSRILSGNGPRSASERPRLIAQNSSQDFIEDLYRLKRIVSAHSALLWVHPEATATTGHLVGNRTSDRQHLEAGCQIWLVPRDRCGGKRQASGESQQTIEVTNMQIDAPPGLAELPSQDEINLLEYETLADEYPEVRELETYNEERCLRAQFSSAIEAGVLECMATIQANRDASGDDDSLLTFDELRTETTVGPTRALLKSLGLYPEEKCHWKRLGIAQWVGYAWEKRELKARKELGEMIISAGARGMLSDTDKDLLDSWCENLAQAVTLCSIDTEEAERKARKRQGSIRRRLPPGLKDIHPLCLELFSKNASSESTEIALTTMNLAETDLSKYAGCVQPQEARMLQGKLEGSLETILNWMLTCEKQQVVTFVSGNNIDAQKIASAWRRSQGRRKALRVLSLVAVLPPIHFGKTVDEIREQVEHPLLDAKLQDVISRHKVLQPPLPITSMTSRGPEITMRSIMVVNMVDRARPAPMELICWTNVTEVADNAVRCVVEVKEIYGWQVKLLLEEANIPRLTQVDAPRRSRASSNQKSANVNGKFCSIWMHFQQQAFDDILQREAISTWLRTQLAVFDALVGWENMIKDQEALVMEFSDIYAVQQHADKIKECLILSSQKCLVTTYESADTWEEAITTQWRGDPLRRIDKILTRGSKDVQTTFASIRALKQTIDDSIQVARARRGSTEQGDPTWEDMVRKATIHLDAGIMERPHWGRRAIDKLAETCGLQLTEISPEDDMTTHTWKPLVDIEGRWLGKICVYLGSAEEVDNLYKKIHGVAINGGRSITLVRMETPIRSESGTYTGVWGRFDRPLQ